MKRYVIGSVLLYLGISFALIIKDISQESRKVCCSHGELVECLLPYSEPQNPPHFPQRESVLSGKLAVWNDSFLRHGNKYWTRMPACAVGSRCFAVSLFPLSLAGDLAYCSGKYLYCTAQKDADGAKFAFERVRKNVYGLLATPFSLISPDLVTNHFIPVGKKSGAIRSYSKLYSANGIELYPKTAEEVQEIVLLAKKLNKKIAIAGKQYSQGKQSLPVHRGDLLLHMDALDQIEIDNENMLCRVGAGATWQQVQEAANREALSVRVSQASNIFSIGGSLSINCHGWDHRSGALDQTVQSLKLVDASGRLLELWPGDELFHLAIGGNGGFGVIVEATFSLVDNSLLQYQGEIVDPKDYLSYFRTKILPNPRIQLHYYRLSLEPEKLFQEAIAVNYLEAGEARVSELLDEPEKGGVSERIKLQTLRRVKEFYPLAWKEEKRAALQSFFETRNVSMRPPIKAILSDSHLDMEWLQEYFVTPEELHPFLMRLASLLTEYRVPILNASVRYIAKNDSKSFNYAPDGERFAVVLFFNQSLHPQEVAKTKVWIRKAVDLVHEHGGSHYLAYQDFPTVEQFQKSYPNYKEIQALKDKWDPERRFESGFFRDYLSGLAPCAYPPSSYRELFDPETGMRDQIGAFLNNIFLQLDDEKFFTLMDDVLSEEKSDAHVFPILLSRIGEAKSNPLKTLWKTLSSLSILKADLSHFAKDLLKDQKFENYLEIGYPGRMIKPLKEQLSLQGKMIVVNTDQRVSDYLQTGIPSPVDQFVPLNDYEPISAESVPTESVDLASLFIGLHHVPEEKLIPFIQSIERVLRPGGKLIFMDHDAKDETMRSYLSLVHSIFNAGTSTSVEEESREYRNFHPLPYWIDLFASCGLRWDGQKPLIRQGDPTLNSVIILEKPRREPAVATEKAARKEIQTYLTGPEWQNVRSSQSYAAFIEHTPFYSYPYFREIGRFWKVYYQSLKAAKAHYSFWEIASAEYTWMNTFIGTVMTIEYGAKGLLSLPLSLILTQPATQEPLTTQVWLRSAPPPEISELKLLRSDQNLHLVEIPRYKKGSAILQTLALSGADFQSIEGNQRIQIDLLLPTDSSYSVPGAQFLYRVPTIEGQFIASYEVPVDLLAIAIRHLARNQIIIDLIHDY